MKMTRWLILIAGVLLIGLGLYAFNTPVENLATITTFVGVIFVISGIAEVFGAASFDGGVSAGKVIGGIISAVIGFWVLFTPVGSASFTAAIVLLFPIWLVINSVGLAVDGFSINKNGGGSGILLIIVGVLGVILSTSLMFDPIASGLSLSYFFAYLLLFQGVSSVIFFFTTKDM